MRLSQVGELGLLAELERLGLIAGVEHDAAQLAGGMVVTQDALVEGVHFRLDRMSWRDLGWRAAAVNLSDLAASGADAGGARRHARASRETELDDVLELYRGLAETGVPVVGGDTTAAPQVVLSVTAIGRSERVPGRAGARPGDLLVVTGPLGGAGAAFRRGGYVRPPLRLDAGRRLARTAHAMLDISDGIASTRAPGAALRRPLRARSGRGCRWPRVRPSTISASARTTSCSRPSPTPPGSSSSAGSKPAKASRLSSTASRTSFAAGSTSRNRGSLRLMAQSEAAAVVERAVASFAAWAESDEATRSEDAYAAEKESAAFEQDLQRCLELDPQSALNLVTPYLSSENRFERAAAGQIVGRIGEAHLGSVTRSCSELLFARLLGENEGEARDSIACGLALIWNASGDELTPLELAHHPNANVRIAAAQNLAMTTTGRPDDAEARAALQVMLEDPDERVRGWAEAGLQTLTPG